MDQKIPELAMLAEFDTSFSQHNVLVGSTSCPYRGNVNYVECPSQSNPPHSITKAAGSTFKVKYSPGKCNATESFDLYIPNSASCGNGVREEGEECETNSVCASGQVCRSCVCVDLTPGGEIGYGCFGAGTPISTPAGQIPIEELVPGDAVLAFDGDAIVTSHVRQVERVERPFYFIIRAMGAEWRVTAEHPMLSNGKKFVEVQFLKAGDQLWKNTGSSMVPIPIDSVERVNDDIVAYNLLLDAPHTFFADGVGVHNPTGMLPAGGVVPIGGHEKNPVNPIPNS
jgi:hypothetical protein